MELSAILDTLCRTGFCPHCRSSLKSSITKLVAWSGEYHYVQLICPNCQEKHLLRIEVTSQDQNLAQPQVPYVPPIAPDELLDLHLLLATHQGDLRSLLAPTPSA